jgi:2'-5' RNA ligase
VALALPDAVRAALVDWRRGPLALQDGLRPVAPEGLHVTLCFLGARPVGEIEAVAGHLRAAAGAGRAPALAVGEPRWLPPRRPRVLAVELEEDGELSALQARLGEALAGAGLWKPEKRPFLAHVTVARVRTGARVPATALAPPEPLAFAGEEVVLYRSRLARTGASYEALARVALA